MVHIINKPTPTVVFETYWKFAAKRQNVFFDRLYAQKNTGNVDSIIAKHRFTNAYRASDRVSQFLIRHVQYDRDWDFPNIVFRTLFFKIFNKIETWENVKKQIGEIDWNTFDFRRYSNALEKIKSQRKPIYSAAYIMPSGKSAFGYNAKHQNHLRLLEKICSQESLDRLRGANSMEGLYLFIKSFPTIGPFTGFQYTIDLNYSALFNFDEADFVVPGPGALDGIRKCFSDLGSYNNQSIIHYMCDNQDKAFEEFAPDFKNLWGRRLQPIDCQNLFCEVDKYSRIAHPEVSGISGRSRIKQVYRRAQRPFERPFYPPKWGLNTQINADKKILTENRQDHREPSQMSLLTDL
jgi:5-hmdU DNA kinase-like protein